MNSAKTIFISHATPADNQFTLWLAIRLMSLGYDVWCDLLKLSKGGDFWGEIEAQIRTKTNKFLLVQSMASNSSEGVLKEIAVAQKVKKARNDPNFILPLKIDPSLSYDDITVDVIRLNSIDFTESWAKGLADLQKALIDQGCPKQSIKCNLSDIMNRLLNDNYAPIAKNEEYDSNWFEIKTPPESLHFYSVDDASGSFDLPVMTYKNCIVTFWSFNNLPEIIKNRIRSSSADRQLRASEYLSCDKQTDFIWSSTYRRLYIGVLTKVIEYSFYKFSGIKWNRNSTRVSFWYPQGVLENDRVGRIHLVGKHKQYNWHFAISFTV